MKHPRESESGFSLIELLVAMVITLIISGAIFGLMTAGQNAFRREPELAERQQSIRLAMDLITRDIANAGSGLPPLTRVFTAGLEGAGPVGPSGVASDDLEMLSVAGRDSEPVCEAAGNGGPTNVSLYRQGVTDLPLNSMVFLVFSEIVPSTTTAPQTQDDRWVARRLTGFEELADPAGGAPAWDLCSPSPGGMHTVLHFAANTFNPSTLCADANLAPRGNFAGTCANLRVTRAVFGQQVRYQIRNAIADGVPVLERLSTEDIDPATFLPRPQVIARGIEEMQVRYSQFTPGTWQDTVPTVSLPTSLPLDNAATRAAFGTMINRLQITLTSRAEGRDLQGAMSNAAGTEDPRVRGSLMTTVSPRAALLGVARGRPADPPSPAPPVDWYWE